MDYQLIEVRMFARPVMTRRVKLAGASASGRFTQARQVNGFGSDEEQSAGPPDWGLSVWAGNPPT